MKTRNLILVSLFAALTAIGAFIKVPVPYVPFTLQYLFCALAGMILGSRLGALSQIVYVVTGLIGIPVFTEGGGLYYIRKAMKILHLMFMKLRYHPILQGSLRISQSI